MGRGGRVHSDKELAGMVPYLIVIQRVSAWVQAAEAFWSSPSSCLIASAKHSGPLRPDKAASLLCTTCLHSNSHPYKLLVKIAAPDEYTL